MILDVVKGLDVGVSCVAMYWEFEEVKGGEDDQGIELYKG